MPYTNAHAFVQALFRQHLTKALFAKQPFKTENFTRDLEKLDPNVGCYFSAGAYLEGYTGTHDAAPCLGLVVLVIDDVGTAPKSRITAEAVELGLGPATTVVCSRPDNYQWAYRLSRMVLKEELGRFFSGVNTLLGKKKGELDGQTVQHLFRLPIGKNLKCDGFSVALRSTDPEVVLDVDEIISNATDTAEPSISEEPQGQWDVMKLAALLPNDDVHYDEWFSTLERFCALAPDRELAREAAELWSAKSRKHDPAEFEKRWISVHPNRTHGGLLLEAVRKTAPEDYKRLEAKAVFNDGEVAPAPPKAKPAKPVFKWIDHKLMPTRDWLYGRLLIRKFLTMTIAPGGRGKSSLIVAEALAQATGKNLIGEKPRRALNVWMWNLEDPQEEVQRRVLAAAKHHKVSEADLGDRLLVSGGRDERLVIADMVGNRPVILQKAVDELIARILEYGIDILIIDPFVSCHKVPENDNIAQDMVMKELNRIAEEGNCAVHIVDHVRKGPSETEIDTQSARGAKAKTDAARVVRVINRMTDLEGKKIYGKSEPWKFIHVFHDKANMAPPRARREWFQLMSVSLENGGVQPGAGAGINTADEVGVIDEWLPPNASDLASMENFQLVVEKMKGKRWRDSDKSPDWIGNAVIASVDPEKLLTRKAIKEIIKAWMDEGLMQISPELDDNRIMRDFIVLGGNSKTVY